MEVFVEHVEREDGEEVDEEKMETDCGLRIDYEVHECGIRAGDGDGGVIAGVDDGDWGDGITIFFEEKGGVWVGRIRAVVRIRDIVICRPVSLIPTSPSVSGNVKKPGY